MRIRIVCYDNIIPWIGGKFTNKMNEWLINMGHHSDISNKPDPHAEINHHIFYGGYEGEKNGVDTLMITHIDSSIALGKIKKQMINAEMGICMSRETMYKLVSLGVPKEKLSFINPAHDGIINPKPKCIGITCQVQNDGRKREFFLSKLAKDISPKLFCFKIMGAGWDKQVKDLINNGFDVEYYNSFDYDKYIKLIPSLDYYLYMGRDEGQMGFIDALAAGVETIVTPQGYHLDAKEGISYPFNTYSELLRIFSMLSDKRLKLIKSISTWTWREYTMKHLDIWNYLLKKRQVTVENKTCFNHEIHSVEQLDESVLYNYNDNNSLKRKLISNSIKHYYFKVFNKLNPFSTVVGK